MGAGNPTISRETETQVPATCQPQPRQPHIIKLISQLQKPTRRISDTWITDTGKRETRYQLVKVHQTIRRPHTSGSIPAKAGKLTPLVQEEDSHPTARQTAPQSPSLSSGGSSNPPPRGRPSTLTPVRTAPHSQSRSLCPRPSWVMRTDFTPLRLGLRVCETERLLSPSLRVPWGETEPSPSTGSVQGRRPDDAINSGDGGPAPFAHTGAQRTQCSHVWRTAAPCSSWRMARGPRWILTRPLDVTQLCAAQKAHSASDGWAHSPMDGPASGLAFSFEGKSCSRFGAYDGWYIHNPSCPPPIKIALPYSQSYVSAETPTGKTGVHFLPRGCGLGHVT